MHRLVLSARGLVGLATIAVAAAGGTSLAAGAWASGNATTSHQAASLEAEHLSARAMHKAEMRADSHFRVFSAKNLDATAATNAGVNVPPSAVRAFAQSGSELYAFNRSPSEMPGDSQVEGSGAICILWVTRGEQDLGCGSAQKVAELGAVMVGSAPGAGNLDQTIEAFLPDSATSMTVTESDGASHAVAVRNNVATVNVTGGDEEVASVSYMLPDGQSRTVDVK